MTLTIQHVDDFFLDQGDKPSGTSITFRGEPLGSRDQETKWRNGQCQAISQLRTAVAAGSRGPGHGQNCHLPQFWSHFQHRTNQRKRRAPARHCGPLPPRPRSPPHSERGWLPTGQASAHSLCPLWGLVQPHVSNVDWPHTELRVHPDRTEGRAGNEVGRWGSWPWGAGSDQYRLLVPLTWGMLRRAWWATKPLP